MNGKSLERDLRRVNKLCAGAVSKIEQIDHDQGANNLESVMAARDAALKAFEIYVRHDEAHRKPFSDSLAPLFWSAVGAAGVFAAMSAKRFCAGGPEILNFFWPLNVILDRFIDEGLLDLQDREKTLRAFGQLLQATTYLQGRLSIWLDDALPWDWKDIRESRSEAFLLWSVVKGINEKLKAQLTSNGD